MYINENDRNEKYNKAKKDCIEAIESLGKLSDDDKKCYL